jgi:hypothetical protein
MKWWAISILLLILICLTVPFVTAEDKVVVKSGGKIGKISTPAAVELKPVDSLAPIKKVIGWKVNTDIEVTINGGKAAILPDDSPLIDVPVTEECLSQHPYGSLYWYQCEVS